MKHSALQGFFQAVWFTTVYRMKIEFSINLVQSHPKSTTPSHGRGWGVRNFVAAKRDLWGKKKLLTPSKALGVQEFFQAVWFNTVYRMKIEFSINLVQSHRKPTTLIDLNSSSELCSCFKRCLALANAASWFSHLNLPLKAKILNTLY